MSKVRIFRCLICGDPYIGTEPPTRCPFCGAYQKFMIPLEEWKDTNDVDLTPVSRKNLEKSLEIEISNAEFYMCVSQISKNENIRGMFKVLSKVEAEHAVIDSKILKVARPQIELKRELCSDDDKASIEESLKRERRAVSLYTQFLADATEPRVREVFGALIEVESDHIALDEEKLKLFK
ncbi:MAG: ferritin [Actinobacteria bacterium]|nr:ferritin [Actinomycetota bacterium]